MKRKYMLCFFIFMLCFISGCQSSDLTKHAMTATNLGFNTVISFTAYTKHENEFKRYQDIVEKEFRRYGQLFDRYNDVDGMNNLKTINDQAGIAPVNVDDDMISLLTLSKQYDMITNHQFDITLGNILEVWHQYREKGLADNAQGKDGALPSLEELNTAAAFKGWDHVIIDEEKRTVYIDDANISLDVGGVAKGFAVEGVAKKLEEAGCKHAIVNGGGNIRLIGNKPEAEYWSVGIQIPEAETQSTSSLLSLKMDASTSFVTSGDYQRYYQADGKKIHHIMNPTTLLPAEYFRSVTVVTADSGIADILSTTLFTITQEEGLKLLKALQDDGLNVEAVWVYDENKDGELSDFIPVENYKIVVSEGLKERIIQ